MAMGESLMASLFNLVLSFFTPKRTDFTKMLLNDLGLMR